MNAMKLALANARYRRLLLSQILSVLGSGLTTIALGLLAYEMAGEKAGTVLGIALALKMVAYVGIAPIASALAERLPRKPFLIVLDCSRALLVLALPFVSEIWHIYVLIVAFQATSAAFTPTFQALIPDILKDEKAYTQALSLSRLTYDLESLISPMLAGLLLSLMAFQNLFAGTAIGFLLSALLVSSVTFPASARKTTAAPFVKRATRGLWIYLATPRLRGMLALYVAVASATSMVIVNTVVIVKADFGFGDGVVAAFFAVSGTGSMLVALILPRLLQGRAPRPVMLAGAGVLSVALLLGAFSPGLILSLGLWFVLGAGAALIQTPSGLLIVRSCHEEDRASVFAAQFALSHSAWLLAYPLVGLSGAWLGLPATFGVMGILSGASTLIAVRLWPSLDPSEIEHEHSEVEHSHEGCEDLHHSVDMPRTANRHKHLKRRHTHNFIIDDHHPAWPRA